VAKAVAVPVVPVPAGEGGDEGGGGGSAPVPATTTAKVATTHAASAAPPSLAAKAGRLLARPLSALSARKLAYVTEE
jgi:hypothetical protein